MIFKIFWFLRAIIFKPFFGRFGLPSYIGRPIYIGNARRIFIGTKVRIFPGARLEVLNSQSSITICDNVSIGQNFHAISGAQLFIGKNSTFAENVMITNVDHGYESLGVHIMSQENRIEETRVGENCFIGFGVVIQAGTNLGTQCIIGANSVVRGDFPEYSVIVGAPARIVKRYNHETKRWEKTNREGSFVDE